MGSLARTRKAPLVSVVMPVHNVAPFVAEALESILAQTASDFEVIVIDDGSTDATVAEVRRVADGRVRLVEFGVNQGVAAALNAGLDSVRGSLVARMDGDDVSHPQRFARQLAFLDRHPEIGVLGTAWSFFGARGGTDRYRSTPAELKAGLLFGAPFSHPTVMIRRALLEENGLRYDPAYEAAEDYDMWARLARVTEMANLPDVLFHQRIHPGSVSHVQRPRQEAAARRVRGDLLHSLGALASPTEWPLVLHEEIVRLTAVPGVSAPRFLDLLPRAEAWLLGLLEANCRSGTFDQAGLTQVVRTHWYKLCRNLDEAGSASFTAAIFQASPLSTPTSRLRWWLRKSIRPLFTRGTQG